MWTRALVANHLSWHSLFMQWNGRLLDCELLTLKSMAELDSRLCLKRSTFPTFVLDLWGWNGRWKALMEQHPGSHECLACRHCSIWVEQLFETLNAFNVMMYSYHPRCYHTSFFGYLLASRNMLYWVNMSQSNFHISCTVCENTWMRKVHALPNNSLTRLIRIWTELWDGLNGYCKL